MVTARLSPHFPSRVTLTFTCTVSLVALLSNPIFSPQYPLPLISLISLQLMAVLLISPHLSPHFGTFDIISPHFCTLLPLCPLFLYIFLALLSHFPLFSNILTSHILPLTLPFPLTSPLSLPLHS